MTGFCPGWLFGGCVEGAKGDGDVTATAGSAFILLPVPELWPPFTRTETVKRKISK